MARTAVALTTAMTTALTLALVACAAPAARTDKAGGEPKPLVLSIGTPDPQDRPGAGQLQAYVEEVTRLTEGRIELRPRWEVVGESDDWDQRAARLVTAGDLDLAVIPARAWDTEGVQTLRPLQAPFLLTSEESVDATLASDAAGEMLAGLEAAGVKGLALFPEGFRYLYAFGDPVRSLADLSGLGSRTAWSETTYAIHEALGMTPDDPNGPAFAQAIISGEVDVLESSFGVAVADEPSVAVGNLPLFVKVNSLVANNGVWDRLDVADQDLLLQAADAVQREMIGVDLADAELTGAEEFCATSSVVHWKPAEIDAAHDAVRPVYAELEADDETKRLLEQVRTIADEAGGSPVTVPVCSPAADPSTEPVAASGDQTVLDGTYRYTIPADYLREGGANDHAVAINSGVLTWTLDGGEYTLNWRSPEEPVVEHGTYTIAKDQATFYLSWIPTSASPEGLPWTVSWDRRADGDLGYTLETRGDFLIEALFATGPWDRLSE